MPVLGHFFPTASLSPEECQGEFLETRPQLRMNGCAANTPPGFLSSSSNLPPPLADEQKAEGLDVG